MADRDHLEGLLDNLPSALVTLSLEMTVIYRNRRTGDLAPTIEAGKDIWDCLGPVTNEEKIDRMLLRGEQVIFRGGPDRTLCEWLLSPERLDDGSRILMAWDAGILDEMVERRITFVIGASHELRSPLTALRGFAEILNLEAETLAPPQAEAAEVILENANHLTNLVDDILDLTRNSFGELRLDLKPLEISSLVRGVAETLRPQIEGRNQSLVIEIDSGLPTIEADAHRLRQVAFNLLQNAHAHSPAGTKIRIAAAATEDNLLLTVSDDGDGLPFEDPEDALREFRRGSDGERPPGAGAGIGLTITKAMVDLHRGSISVRSEKGAGTSFEVSLPLDREAARKRIFTDRP